MKKNYLLLLVSSSLILASCANKTQSGALIGTGTGAAVGAGIGALAGGGKGAIIGAAAGAVVGGVGGAAIGNYMDRQEKEMREKVKSAKIERVGNDLVVKFDSGILFDSGKADLRTASEKALGDFASILKAYPNTNITIEGHTDNTGAKKTNEALSANRAGSVEKFLVAKGVADPRVNTMGYADTKPVADNATDQGRQQNRRVEVKIVPIADKIK